MGAKYDFSGWATKNDLRCSDGRVIRRNAFIDCDGKTVPLVWNHQHNSVDNVLGHAVLENRDEGVYTYGYFNETEAGKNAKSLVEHGDVVALSIYANKLKQSGHDVLHGMIREVSLVLAGANPGASIDSFVLEHSDEPSDDEGIVYTGEPLVHADDVKTDDEEEKKEPEESADEGKEPTEGTKEVSEEGSEDEPAESAKSVTDSDKKSEKPEEDKEKEKMAELSHAAEKEKTVQDVFDSMTEEQKTVVYALIGQALEDKENENSEGGKKEMSHNIFESDTLDDTMVLSHSDMEEIFRNARKCGSLKDAFESFATEHNLDMDSLSHSITDDDGKTVNYGIANVKYLFPDARTMGVPEFINNNDEWVAKVLNGVHRTPFSRVKSLFADITMDDARAKGYLKGNLKKDEVFKLLKRTAEPTTVYKKQAIDRDDVSDIIDFDVVAWIRGEMRIKLNEELARAILIGDQRSAQSDEKIDESKIRPIWTDSELFTIVSRVEKETTDTDESFAKKCIKSMLRARKNYKGSGNLTCFTTEDFLTDCLLIEDTTGRAIYDTEDKLKMAMRVKDIVTVPQMENVTREVEGVEYTLVAILVNLNDYNVGADKGGAINMFDDFDIDYNKQKYLIETRCSGSLVKPYSAIVIESYESGE